MSSLWDKRGVLRWSQTSMTSSGGLRVVLGCSQTSSFPLVVAVAGPWVLPGSMTLSGHVLLDLQEVLLDLLGGLGGLSERSFVGLLGGPDGLPRGLGGPLGCPRVGSLQKWYQSILTVSRNLVAWL